MGAWTYDKLKEWRRVRKNRSYNAAYMQNRRKHFRALYVRGKIAYADIPKAYRYFKEKKTPKIKLRRRPLVKSK